MNTNKIKSYLISKRMNINKEYQIRPMISYLKSIWKTNLTGAEIGVATGLNAKSMLMNLDINNLYLIDTYSYCDWHYKSTLKNVSKFKKKVCFVRKLSDDAVNAVPKLDFIYIDGDHTYEAVIKDIQNYYPLVKKGGMIGDHDFWAHDIGVVKAVLEFAKKEKLKLYGKEWDWWVIKND